MSEVPNNDVYKGYWVDQSYGAVLGATITTDSRTGTIIIAFLALFVSLTATHMWNLFIFAFHQYYANPGYGDFLYHQQQALLRTLPQPDVVIVDYCRLAWYWRHKAKRVFVRCFPLPLISLVFLGSMIMASIFSSLVVETNDIDVLVENGNCKFPSFNGGNLTNTVIWQSTVASSTSAYSQNCYSTSTVPSLCKQFVQPRLPLFTRKVSCPFDPSICNKGVGLELDTGYIDSHSDLGINALSQDRVKYRTRLTCAPLVVKDRYNIQNLTDQFQHNNGRPNLPGEQGFFFHYGESFPHKPGGPPTNFTFGLSSYTSNLTVEYNGIVSQNYTGDPGFRDGSFNPIPSLKVENADLNLIFVVPGYIQYLFPNDDPVFSAHKKRTVALPGFEEQKITVYTPDFPTGVVGCAQQQEFCIVTGDGTHGDCTGLIGIIELISQAKNHKGLFARMNSIQNATAFLILDFSASIEVIQTAPRLPVDASRYLTSGLSVSQLPDNQWETEVKGWVGFALAQMQVYIGAVAEGPPTNIEQGASVPPSTSGEEYLCRSFKMKKAGGFANINVFGLAFIIAVGSVFLILDGVLLKFIIYISRVRKRLSPQVDRWIQNGVWQLQRRAYEARAEGSWIRLDKEIPLTQTDEVLSDLSAAYLATKPPQLNASDSDSTATASATANAQDAIMTTGSSNAEDLVLVDGSATSGVLTMEATATNHSGPMDTHSQSIEQGDDRGERTS